MIDSCPGPRTRPAGALRDAGEHVPVFYAAPYHQFATGSIGHVQQRRNGLAGLIGIVAGIVGFILLVVSLVFLLA